MGSLVFHFGGKRDKSPAGRRVDLTRIQALAATPPPGPAGRWRCWWWDLLSLCPLAPPWVAGTGSRL